jgi:hypothetical protein
MNKMSASQRLLHMQQAAHEAEMRGVILESEDDDDEDEYEEEDEDEEEDDFDDESIDGEDLTELLEWV